MYVHTSVYKCVTIYIEFKYAFKETNEPFSYYFKSLFRHSVQVPR